MCELFNSGISNLYYIAPNDNMTSGKGTNDRGCGPIWGNITKFAWRDWWQSRRATVYVGGLRSEILNRIFSNRKQERSTQLQCLCFQHVAVNL